MGKGNTKRSIWIWEEIGAIVGFVGILAALFGGLLTASSWILGAELHPWLQSFGTVLLISTIPLLVFGGYCLNWMERDPKKSPTDSAREGERNSISLTHLAATAVFFLVFSAIFVSVSHKVLGIMMNEQLIMTGFAVALTCGLLLLRYLFIGRQNKRRSHRLYFIRILPDNPNFSMQLIFDKSPKIKLRVNQSKLPLVIQVRAMKSRRNETTSASKTFAKSIRVVVFTLFVGILLVPHAHAQQTIFNVPTTDVLNKGKVYAELDASFKVDDSDALNRFSSFVPRVVVGVGHNIEAGLNITGNIQPGRDTTTLVPTFKWKFYDGGEKNGVALEIGDNIFVPVRNRQYKFGNYIYAEASKTFKKNTRLTAGAYHFSANVVARNAQRAGGQFGFEQTVNSKLTLAADWYTGKHANGYFTPGAIFKPTPKTTVYASYSLGNENLSRGNHFFLIEFGYNFN